MRTNWYLLGIDPTTDLKQIKRAYANQSRRYHPEEYPSEFQALQEAYQAVLDWRRAVLEQEQANVQSVLHQHAEAVSARDASVTMPPEPSSAEQGTEPVVLADTQEGAQPFLDQSIDTTELVDMSEVIAEQDAESLEVDVWHDGEVPPSPAEQGLEGLDLSDLVFDQETVAASDLTFEQETIDASDLTFEQETIDASDLTFEQETIDASGETEEVTDRERGAGQGSELFRSETQEHMEEQEAFLDRLQEELHRPLTAAGLERYLKQALSLGFLSNPVFLGRLTEILEQQHWEQTPSNFFRLHQLFVVYELQHLSQQTGNWLEARGYQVQAKSPPVSAHRAPTPSSDPVVKKQKSRLPYILLALVPLLVRLVLTSYRTYENAQKPPVTVGSYVPPAALHIQSDQVLDGTDWMLMMMLYGDAELRQDGDQYYVDYPNADSPTLLEGAQRAFLLPLEQPGLLWVKVAVAQLADGTWVVYLGEGKALGHLDREPLETDVLQTDWKRVWIKGE